MLKLTLVLIPCLVALAACESPPDVPECTVPAYHTLTVNPCGAVDPSGAYCQERDTDGTLLAPLVGCMAGGYECKAACMEGGAP